MIFVNNIQQTWLLFSKKNRLKAVLLYMLVLFNVFLEILSIGSIVPILIFFLEENIITKYPFILSIFEVLQFEYNSLNLFYLLIISIFLLFLLKSITLSIQIYLESNLSWGVTNEIRKRLFERYLLNDISFHNNKHSSTAINNLTRELDYLFHSVSNLINLFTQLTLSVIICTTLFIFKPFEFFIILSLVLIVLLFFNLFTAKNLNKKSNLRQIFEESIAKQIVNGLGGIREIKVFNLEKKFLKIFNLTANNLFKIAKKIQIFVNLPRIILELSIVTAILALLYNLVNSNIDTNTIFTTAGIFTIAAIKLLPSVNKIYQGFQSLKVNAPSVEVLSSDLKITDDFKKLNEVNNQIEFKFEDEIEIKNLFFKYKNQIIFEDINLRIKKLDLIGIRGESGIGKSTLIDLIIGLKNPDSGKILIDGNKLNFNNKNWLKKISYVPQDIFLMDDTIKNNITFQFDKKDFDEKNFRKACEEAEIYDTFLNLPESFDTMVGERGSKISIGQRQRIGLARALYRKPKLLLLDETTSSLDTFTKNKILQTIKNINKYITVIIVSHDETILSGCKNIVEIKNRKLIYK